MLLTGIIKLLGTCLLITLTVISFLIELATIVNNVLPVFNPLIKPSSTLIILVFSIT